MKTILKKKTVSVARALKEKNRLKGRIAAAREAVSEQNSREGSNPRKVDVREQFLESRALVERLTALKAAIAEANRPIVRKIIELAETKSEIAWLNGLNTKEGQFQENSYGNRVVRVFDAVITGPDVVRELEILRRRAERLQDELDEFNVTARIEIEVEDED